MTYDIDFCITCSDQWQDELKQMLRMMASPSVRSVRLIVPNYRLKVHVQDLLEYTGFGYAFVSVSYLKPV